jgi:transposase
MHVSERQIGDVERLKQLIRGERDAKQRDRFRMVALALGGEEKLRIAELLGVAKSTVEKWAYAYRDGGIDALYPGKAPGATPKLTPEQQEAFRRRMLEGPRPEDGVCALRGREAVRILNDEFGVGYSLNGVYDLLHRLGLSCLSPRPRHEKNDPTAMEAFKKSAPLLSSV